MIYTRYITCRDKPSRYYTCSFLGLMVICGPSIFYFSAFRSKFFGRPVFIDSVVWFRANGPTSYLMIDTIEFSLYLYFKHAAALNTKLTLSCCKRVVCISVYVLREQWLRE